jgi:hypothetical protein
VVPVRQGYDDLIIVLEIGIWIIDDNWASQSIWVLATSMTVVEVCARLFDLDPSVNFSITIERIV